ncbi:MAG: glucokinase [Gammaproteobacteria bacterium]|nr:glucokinase [Gammaproteobacteria bacterium]
MWVLAGDIGGTSTRLQLAQRQADGWAVQAAMDYRSGEYAHLRDIVRIHLQTHELTHLASACFAVAGPVQKQFARITNLPWALEVDDLQQQLNIGSVALINDFTAVAHGLSELDKSDLVTLQQTVAQRDGAIAILGAGTGLGQAIVKPFDDQLVVIDGEGGHVDFAPRTGEEIALLQYWQAQVDRVSYETFLSGKGLTRIFEFYRQSENVDAGLAQAMTEQDPAAAITDFALHYKEPLAVRTVRSFVRIYAAQAANLALVAKATGGVYLAGGIAPKIIGMLQSDEFLQVFNDKPPMQHLLATIPVHVIMNTHVGLLGALKIAKQLVS